MTNYILLLAMATTLCGCGVIPPKNLQTTTIILGDDGDGRKPVVIKTDSPDSNIVIAGKGGKKNSSPLDPKDQ